MAISAVSVIGSRQSGKETVSLQPKLLDRLQHLRLTIDGPRVLIRKPYNT